MIMILEIRIVFGLDWYRVRVRVRVSAITLVKKKKKDRYGYVSNSLFPL